MATSPRAPTELLRASQVAEILGVSSRQVRRWAESGELQSARLSERVIRFRAEAVVEFIARSEVVRA